MGRERPNDFPIDLKWQVRREQRFRCGLCGKKCNGHTPDSKLQIHHKQPNAWGGQGERKNAVGLDPDCHQYVDTLTLDYGIPYEMIAGQDYYIGLPKKEPRKKKR